MVLSLYCTLSDTVQDVGIFNLPTGATFGKIEKF